MQWTETSLFQIPLALFGFGSTQQSMKSVPSLIQPTSPKEWPFCLLGTFLMTVLCLHIQMIITYFPEVSTKDNEGKLWQTSYTFIGNLGTTAWHRLITLTTAEIFYQRYASVDDLNVRLIITPLLKYTSLFRKKYSKVPIGLFRSIKLLPLFTCNCVQNNEDS